MFWLRGNDVNKAASGFDTIRSDDSIVCSNISYLCGDTGDSACTCSVLVSCAVNSILA